MRCRCNTILVSTIGNHHHMPPPIAAIYSLQGTLVVLDGARAWRARASARTCESCARIVRKRDTARRVHQTWRGAHARSAGQLLGMRRDTYSCYCIVAVQSIPSALLRHPAHETAPGDAAPASQPDERATGQGQAVHGGKAQAYSLRNGCDVTSPGLQCAKRS